LVAVTNERSTLDRGEDVPITVYGHLERPVPRLHKTMVRIMVGGVEMDSVSLLLQCQPLDDRTVVWWCEKKGHELPSPTHQAGVYRVGMQPQGRIGSGCIRNRDQMGHVKQQAAHHARVLCFAGTDAGGGKAGGRQRNTRLPASTTNLSAPPIPKSGCKNATGGGAIGWSLSKPKARDFFPNCPP
jgi:hypothetical protein